MINLKQQLTSDVAGIILRYVKSEKGRLTWISEVASINRSEFNRRGLAKMKHHRLLRVIYALSLNIKEKEFHEFMHEISETILCYAEDYDEYLLTQPHD